ncbi:MAG: MBL fold metallo-hydrolase [Sedimentisphaerales bacterium]|nr:MBL fold metallo-hydrolase [Sedimentisphaerales bacterium]
MLKIRRVFLVCALVCLSLVITVIAQNAPASRVQGGQARGVGATTTVLSKALVTGTMRFQSEGINMYLVVGNEKALLIDTGNPGFISPEEIKALTSLPLLVVNTHAHPDHSGSNNAFAEVYVHEADLESCKRYSGSNVKLIPIKDGYIFDLGGKKIEVIEVRGHTPGSICLLDAQDKVLFGGDTANTETWAQISNVPLETYKKSMERLQEKYKGKYDRLLPGHNDVLPASYMDEMIACADEILSGKAEQPTQTAANSQDPLRAGSLTHTYKSAKIRYNPNNLREK